MSARTLERLIQLRTTGFRKLREGKIHARCYSCGRKQSNTLRMEYDPPHAMLIETPCERCSQGAKEPESFYYDARGVEICYVYDKDVHDYVWETPEQTAARPHPLDGAA